MTERYLKVPVELLCRVVRGDPSLGANAFILVDAWKAMAEIRKMIAYAEPGEPAEERKLPEERRVKDRRVSPAIGDFALEERQALLARIEELQQKAVVLDLYTDEAQRLGFGGISEALDVVAAQAEKIEYQDAVIVQRNNEISRRFAEAEELKKDAGRWRALLNCARIRFFGWAGYTNPDPYGKDPGNYRHFGADFWSIHPHVAGEDKARAKEILEGFADACVALSERKTPTEG